MVTSINASIPALIEVPEPIIGLPASTHVNDSIIDFFSIFVYVFLINISVALIPIHTDLLTVPAVVHNTHGVSDRKYSCPSARPVCVAVTQAVSISILAPELTVDLANHSNLISAVVNPDAKNALSTSS